MKFTDFKLTISNSNPNSWSYDDELGLYVYLEDIRITIQAVWEDENQPFQEGWVERYPDKKAYRKVFNLCFNGYVIERFYSAAVDGWRAYVPYPKRVDMTISREQYAIGMIINKPLGRDFNDYLSSAGITVEEVPYNDSYESPYDN